MGAVTLKPHMQVGRFELLSFLGKGGRGEVWRARDPRLGREVAVKVLPPRVVRDEERVGRFEREARALAACNHPNIAQIYEVGEWRLADMAGTGEDAAEPLRFLVMELVDGGSLAARLAEGPLPPREAVPLLLQVASALQAAHASGVIHRDLKPANILLAADGTAKVVDFGLARFFRRREEAGDSDITQAVSTAGIVVGTASYMAPEQVRGEECDEKCDVWAFGCCLGEVLTGHRLFDGASVPEIVGKVLAGLPDLSDLPATTPRPVRRLLQRCLIAERGARPTMAEVVATLAGEEPGATRRRRWAAAALAAGVLALALAVTLVVRRPAEIRRAPPFAGDLRVAVVADDDRGRGGRSALADRLRDRLLAVATQTKGVQAVLEGQEDVSVHVRAAGAGDGERVHITLEDRRRGAIVAALDENLGEGDGAASVETVAQHVAAALQLEGIRRQLEAEDALHGFLVRRTASLPAARAFRDGLQYYTRTRMARAGELLEEARQADPRFWPALVYLAQVAGSQARFREGRELLAACRSLVRDPQGAELAVLEVAESLLSEDLQRLLEALERARRWFPDSGELMYRTAWAYRSVDRPEKAIPLLEELIRSGWQPDWSPTWEQLAMNQLLSGRTAAARATAAEGEARFPERFSYPFVAACAWQMEGNGEAAREALARAIRKRLDFSTSDQLVSYQTIQWWASLVRWDEEVVRQRRAVLAEAERRLANAPADPSLLLARGEALQGLGRAAEAAAVLESFRGDSAGEPYRLLALAKSRAATGDRAGAAAALEEAGELWRSRQAPALGRLAYNIGCAWCAMGEAEEALGWFLRARDQYGLDRLDLALDPELDLLRKKGLLAGLARR